MRFYIRLFVILSFSMLALFGLLQWIGMPIPDDPNPWLGGGNLPAGLITTGLLIADVFLPIPSSLLMVANGALFGTLVGSLLSLVGTFGAALVGYGLGISGSERATRAVSVQEQARVTQFVARWGELAIIVTRPIPILAESVAIVAGVSRIPLRTLIRGSIIGNLPGAVLYALAGATAADVSSALLVFLLVLGIGGIFWFIGLRSQKALISNIGGPNRVIHNQTIQ